MPPLPTIPGVFRITLPFVGVEGVNPANVFHFDTELTDLDDIGAAFDTGWQAARAVDEPLWVMTDTCIASTIDILPLDGASATHTYTLGTVIQGNSSGDFIPEAAAVVSLKTAQRGARGRGRKFIGPLCESRQADGKIPGVDIDHLRDGWTALLSEFSDPVADIRLGIASYVHADFHPVTSFAVDSFTGVLRRRHDVQRS